MDLDSKKPFIWRKKYEEMGIKIDEKALEAEALKRIEENKIELEKIRERQRLRELEYQQKLNDSEFLQRQKEAQQHEHWEQQEDHFVLRQQRHGSKLRIREGRAKPIDYFAHYVDIFGAKIEDHTLKEGYIREDEIELSDPVELLNPVKWFNGLRQSDLETLETDIGAYMSADHEDNQQFWEDVLDITRNELSKLQAAKAQSKSAAAEIVTDVMSLFEGKTIKELDEMEEEMSEMLNDDNPSVDVAFYENALARLRAYRADIRLSYNHKQNLKRHKNKLLNNEKEPEEKPSLLKPKYEDVESDKNVCKSTIDDIQDDVKMKVQEPSSQTNDEAMMVEDGEDDDNEDDDNEDDEDEEQDPRNPSGDVVSDKFEEARKRCIQVYETGRYTPEKFSQDDLDSGIVCVDHNSDYEILTQQRNRVSNASSLDEVKKVTMTSEERAFMDAAMKGMNSQEESVFSCETNVRGADNRIQTYAWADKYQPRKPRYFNRVHTGFEWNKYNQTHYDVDNPPPKVVQGYKFNIFYPDLMDKTKAPTFTLTPCKDDKDFSIIRFSAGPPYEDIAFKIVNREWNNSHKSGYRCQFINNMLQLWFQFKRYRYRR